MLPPPHDGTKDITAIANRRKTHRVVRPCRPAPIPTSPTIIGSPNSPKASHLPPDVLGPSFSPTEPAVATVTVTVMLDDPFNVIDAGTVQVEPAGPPLQLSATICLNPPTGVIATEKFAD